MTQYVNPALDTAKAHITPAYETAVDAASTHLPTLKKAGSQAWESVMDTPRHADVAKAHLEKVLDPVFLALGKASPAHRDALPKHPVDRLLMLLLAVVAALVLLKFSFRSLKITLRLSRFAAKVVRFFTKLPLWIAFKALAWSFWVATGFYVCGLCKRRKAAKVAEKAPAKAKEAKGGAQAKGPASVADLQRMLEASKQKGKLQDGVKSLSTSAKTGKPLSVPKDMEGMHVTKDTLKKALGKFKEVDIKKLGL